MLAVEAAPLGAFLPWQPLTEVALPAIASGASAIVTAEVTSRRPAPLGSFANLPPRRLLTALLTPDEEPANRPASPATGVLSLLFGGRRRTDLPADLFDLLGRGNPHWAGNLNVFVGGKPVERHRARALRIYPGRANLAFFLLGSGPDAYSLRIEGDGAQWTTLLDATDCDFAVRSRTCRPPGRVPVDRDHRHALHPPCHVPAARLAARRRRSPRPPAFHRRDRRCRIHLRRRRGRAGMLRGVSLAQRASARDLQSRSVPRRGVSFPSEGRSPGRAGPTRHLLIYRVPHSGQRPSRFSYGNGWTVGPEKRTPLRDLHRARVTVLSRAPPFAGASDPGAPNNVYFGDGTQYENSQTPLELFQ